MSVSAHFWLEHGCNSGAFTSFYLFTVAEVRVIIKGRSNVYYFFIFRSILISLEISFYCWKYSYFESWFEQCGLKDGFLGLLCLCHQNIVYYKHFISFSGSLCKHAVRITRYISICSQCICINIF